VMPASITTRRLCCNFRQSNGPCLLLHPRFYEEAQSGIAFRHSITRDTGCLQSVHKRCLSTTTSRDRSRSDSYNDTLSGKNEQWDGVKENSTGFERTPSEQDSVSQDAKRPYKIERQARCLHLNWQSGPVSYLPWIWLRDQCQCPKCVNPDTMQRAIDTFQIDKKIAPKDGVRGISATKEGLLEIFWGNDGHRSQYTADWLREHTKSKNAWTKDKGHILWGADIAFDPPAMKYEEIMASDEGVAKWTQKITEYGFCFVDGCPVSPEKTQQLLERIAFIRVTHYGKHYHRSPSHRVIPTLTY